MDEVYEMLKDPANDIQDGALSQIGRIIDRNFCGINCKELVKVRYSISRNVNLSKRVTSPNRVKTKSTICSSSFSSVARDCSYVDINIVIFVPFLEIWKSKLTYNIYS